jgi:transcriptional regulator NrdR family protein
LSSLVSKSSGKDEPFNAKKLHASLIATLSAAHVDSATAESIADTVSDKFIHWLGQKKHVTSKEIREHCAQFLRDHNHIAAYLYEKHKILS